MENGYSLQAYAAECKLCGRTFDIEQIILDAIPTDECIKLQDLKDTVIHSLGDRFDTAQNRQLISNYVKSLLKHGKIERIANGWYKKL